MALNHKNAPEPVEQNGSEIVVQVIEISTGREIDWGAHAVERLVARVADVKRAVTAGASAISASLDDIPANPRWRVHEVSASFGITLAAEAGVILSKAASEATFEVTVTFQRA
ncbi:CU044_2847 family protein [Catellatospora chokoriensis]|uniref:Trypsin-co-occurring domain-containing protein n=1 Tax=Catellatospora chokoriensis TaxID=310353 RepID=A0A8J3K6B2_9ACTN|nr:CU044_2847 family protein [Catellatospora chokoriensis]GIF90259.1 hypothetical protein Cch02nite_37030 [Catellatospora chokoriensis]